MLLPYLGFITIAFFIVGSYHNAPLIVAIWISFGGGLYLKSSKISSNLLVSGLLCVILLGCISALAYLLLPNWIIYVFNSKALRSFQAPELSLITPTNDTIQLSDLHQGSTLVLDFWSSDCGVCFENFPELDRIYNSYDGGASQAVKIISVNLPIKFKEEPMSRRRKVASKQPYSFPIYFGDASYWENFFIEGVPQVAIISPEGSVIYNGGVYTGKFEYVYNLERMIQKIIKESR